MFVVHQLNVAILLCVLTMLGWGSWANTQKLAGKRHWPFPLYYFDYAFGVFLFALLLFFTAGSFGAAGSSALENMQQAGGSAIGRALLSGLLFNIANVLLVVAIDAAGMAIAFPVGIGLALFIGTVTSYMQSPKGNLTLLSAGVIFVIAAMIVSALAHRKMHSGNRSFKAGRGLIFALIAGSVMGLFYPQLSGAISPEFNRLPVEPGMLTPYTALLFFAIGMLASNFVVNPILIRASHLNYHEYLQASPWLHSLGIAGGCIWMLALSANIVASGVAGPAISYALGQGATLVAAIWGVFVWKEFRGGPGGTNLLVALMLMSYALGLTIIGLATL
jgi:glucose uptake protein